MANAVWISLRFLQGPGGLWLSLADDRGSEVASGDDFLQGFDASWPQRTLLLPLPVIVHVPPDLDVFIEETLRRAELEQLKMPLRLRDQYVPAYVSPPPTAEGLDWENACRSLWPEVRAIGPVRRSRSNQIKRPPFNLPIDILAVGKRAAASFKPYQCPT